MLGLEAEPATALVGDPALADVVAVEEVAAIELDPGLGGEHVHHPAGLRLADRRRECQAVGVAVDDVIVVIARSKSELLVLLFNPGPDGRRLAEIQRRAVKRGDLANGNRGRVNRRVLAGVDRQYMVENRAGTAVLEVEVGMVGQVDDGWLVSAGLVVDPQLVAVGPRVRHGSFQRTGIALFAALAHIGKRHAVARRGGRAFPDHLVETLDAAV